MKKISIVIPVFNTQDYLEECLKSIIISKKDFEIILVNDGSTDKSEYICNKYVDIDKRIKTYHKTNGGVSSARNYGITKATGDYIMLVDADDIVSSNWDEVFAFLEDKDIYYFSNLINKDTNKNDLLRYITGANAKKIYLSGPYSKVYKRDFIQKNNLYFNEELINGEDMLYNVEAIILANTYQIVNIQYYLYRQAIGQATKKFNEKIIDSDIAFHKNLKEIFDRFNIDNTVSNDIKNFCLANAVTLILNRISYIKSYQAAKEFFIFLKQDPYYSVINNKTKEYNNSFIFRFCRLKQYRLVFYYLKFRNKISFYLRNKMKGQFINM